MKVVLSGGGTGGHVNPALNIAKAIKKQDPTAEISFVGTKRGIESTLVPKAGYEIDFVEVQGFRRKLNFKGLKENCKALYKAVASVHQAKKILKERDPDVVVGTGGYACYPVLNAAAELKIPTIIHESNAYPGLVTRTLGKKLSRVRPIHLSVVELKRKIHIISEEMSRITSPNNERIIEDATIHSSSKFQLRVDDGRRADHHTLSRQIPVDTTFRNFRRVLQVITIVRF